MSDNVVILNVDTMLDLPPERILDGARDAQLQDILLLGYDPDMNFYMASTTVDAGKMLILLERAHAAIRHQLRIES